MSARVKRTFNHDETWLTLDQPWRLHSDTITAMAGLGVLFAVTFALLARLDVERFGPQILLVLAALALVLIWAGGKASGQMQDERRRRWLASSSGVQESVAAHVIAATLNDHHYSTPSAVINLDDETCVAWLVEFIPLSMHPVGLNDAATEFAGARGREEYAARMAWINVLSTSR